MILDVEITIDEPISRDVLDQCNLEFLNSMCDGEKTVLYGEVEVESYEILEYIVLSRLYDDIKVKV